MEFLARLAAEPQTNPHDIVRATLGGSEEDWKKFLFNGFKPDSAPQPIELKLYGSFPGGSGSQPTKDSLEVIFYRDAKVDDGRYANNGWMQELPDPITKMTWDNAVLVSRQSAKELGVANGDIVEVRLNNGVAFNAKQPPILGPVNGPIWVQPGMADYSIGLALGYGREKAGRVGTGVGFNAYKLQSDTINGGKYVVAGATLKKTGETHVLACTQHHWSMEGRPAVREFNLSEAVEAAERKENIAEEKFHGVEPPIVK